MRWYAITWIDNEGKGVKRELLHRADQRKIWEFIRGRITYRNIPAGAVGVWFWEAMPEETWDDLFDEERRESLHAVEVPVYEDFFRA